MKLCGAGVWGRAAPPIKETLSDSDLCFSGCSAPVFFCPRFALRGR